MDIILYYVLYSIYMQDTLSIAHSAVNTSTVLLSKRANLREIWFYENNFCLRSYKILKLCRPIPTPFYYSTKLTVQGDSHECTHTPAAVADGCYCCPRLPSLCLSAEVTPSALVCHPETGSLSRCGPVTVAGLQLSNGDNYSSLTLH